VKVLRVSAAAERDLDNIWNHVAVNSGSIDRANKFVDAITQRLSVLAHSPKAGTARTEIDVGFMIAAGPMALLGAKRLYSNR